MLSIIRIVENAGASIAFPTQSIHLEGLPINIGVDEKKKLDTS